MKAAADRFGVVEIIDRHVPERARGLSVGTTLLLAALNRAIRPRSKRGWAAWAQQTSLARLFAQVQLEQLTSQFCWDQRDCVKLEALRAIEDELTRVIVRELGIKLDTLFYDATNFFTFIASTNARPELAQRGHSKQKRSDQRLFSLALLVSREGHIPLCSQVYEGNRVDACTFPESLTLIRERLAMVLKPAGTRGGRPRCEWTLEQTEPETLRLFHHLVPAQPPIVYTWPLPVIPRPSETYASTSPRRQETRARWPRERSVAEGASVLDRCELWPDCPMR